MEFWVMVECGDLKMSETLREDLNRFGRIIIDHPFIQKSLLDYFYKQRIFSNIKDNAKNLMKRKSYFDIAVNDDREYSFLLNVDFDDGFDDLSSNDRLKVTQGGIEIDIMDAIGDFTIGTLYLEWVTDSLYVIQDTDSIIQKWFNL